MIHTFDVDTQAARPNGQDRQEDQALPVGSDGRGVEADCAIGCGWRMLPVHSGHWRTVFGWFRELARRFLFQTIHDVELMLDRERQGREASPSAAVIDSQSVKAPHAETRGYDAAKKIVGRKRHSTHTTKTT
jgi:hypothetical protein